MGSIYNYRFDHDGKSIVVHFVDKSKNIDVTEALAQIGHAARREWALESIQLMNRADKMYWINFPIQRNMECPFGRRLVEENWENSNAFLMLADTQITLYINRSLFILVYYNIILYKQYALNVTASS